MANQNMKANQTTKCRYSLKNNFPKNRPKSEMLNYNDAHLSFICGINKHGFVHQSMNIMLETK